MFSARKNLVAPKKEALPGFSGTSAVLMADMRDIAKVSQRVSPIELVERLKRVTTALISAIEKKEGIVYGHIGGSLIAYWPPSMMPAAAESAMGAASDAIAACGASLAVSVSIAELALADMGAATSKRPLLVGAAYQRAEATLRVCPAGVVAVDSPTLAVLSADLRARFVMGGDHAELQSSKSPIWTSRNRPTTNHQAQPRSARRVMPA